MAYTDILQPSWNPKGTSDWIPASGPAVAGGYGGVPNYNPAQVITQQLPYLPAINQAGINYLSQGVPGFGALSTQESANIGALLNPTDFTDISRTAAERNLGGGVAGSGFGVMNQARLTEDEKLRRQQLGSSMLSGAVSRLPGPFNPANLSYQSPLGPVRPAGGAVPFNSPTVTGTGGGAPPLVSPGNAPPSGIMGTPTPRNLVADLMAQYDPASPYNPFTTPTYTPGLLPEEEIPGFAGGSYFGQEPNLEEMIPGYSTQGPYGVDESAPPQEAPLPDWMFNEAMSFGG